MKLEVEVELKLELEVKVELKVKLEVESKMKLELKVEVEVGCIGWSILDARLSVLQREKRLCGVEDRLGKLWIC